MAQQTMPLQDVIRNVQRMTSNSNARNIVRKEGYSIHSVTWEDCARNKGSVWGPCISDMTLQVGNSRMPVIRKDNYTDTTWDVKMDEIPIVVGNETIFDQDENKSNINANNEPKLTTITLKEYLRNFNKYMTAPPKSKSNANNNSNNNNVAPSFPMSAVSDLFEDEGAQNGSESINLLRSDESKDSHVIVSSQACFLPIETGKETLFNVALFNYQSKKNNPAVLAIVATSKGTSAQIIQGSDQKLLFNNFGSKADFIGQRLTDNRIERGVKDLSAPMTREEKQDNCIVIIQVPLKQKKQPNRYYSDAAWGGAISGMDDFGFGSGAGLEFDCIVPQAQQAPQANSFSFGAVMKSSSSMQQSMPKKRSLQRRGSSMAEENANVESAIVKVAPKTTPICKCGENLEKLQLQFCYDNYGKPAQSMCTISCDECGKNVTRDAKSELERKQTIVYHCKKEKNAWQHRQGYDLCIECAKKQLKFDEMGGADRKDLKLERDEKYPIRVTLQYYKSTDNGVISASIMKVIAKQLKESQNKRDYVGSLVTQYNSNRPTEWVQYAPFRLDYNNFDNKFEKNYGLVKDVLGNLGLSGYYNTFVKNEISDGRLILIEESDLKMIFDKVGPLSVFRHWLRNYKKDVEQGKQQNGQNGQIGVNNNGQKKRQDVDFGVGLFGM